MKKDRTPHQSRRSALTQPSPGGRGDSHRRKSPKRSVWWVVVGVMVTLGIGVWYAGRVGRPKLTGISPENKLDVRQESLPEPEQEQAMRREQLQAADKL